MDKIPQSWKQLKKKIVYESHLQTRRIILDQYELHHFIQNKKLISNSLYTECIIKLKIYFFT